MARIAGTKNKRTLLRKSQEAMSIERDPNKIADMLYINGILGNVLLHAGRCRCQWQTEG